MSNGLKMARVVEGRDVPCDTKYKLTKHALTRMKERDISMEDVYGNARGRKPVLITASDGHGETVITTYRERPKALVKKFTGLGNFPTGFSKTIVLPAKRIGILMKVSKRFMRQYNCQMDVSMDASKGSDYVRIAADNINRLQALVGLIEKFARSGVQRDLGLDPPRTKPIVQPNTSVHASEGAEKQKNEHNAKAPLTVPVNPKLAKVLAILEDLDGTHKDSWEDEEDV